MKEGNENLALKPKYDALVNTSNFIFYVDFRTKNCMTKYNRYYYAKFIY